MVPAIDRDGQPSCSAAEALERQEPFVNPTLANHALALLARLFRYGTASYHGGFVSLSSLAGLQALRVDPEYWQRLRTKANRRQTAIPNPVPEVFRLITQVGTKLAVSA